MNLQSTKSPSVELLVIFEYYTLHVRPFVRTTAPQYQPTTPRRTVSRRNERLRLDSETAIRLSTINANAWRCICGVLGVDRREQRLASPRRWMAYRGLKFDVLRGLTGQDRLRPRRPVTPSNNKGVIIKPDGKMAFSRVLSATSAYIYR